MIILLFALAGVLLVGCSSLAAASHRA